MSSIHEQIGSITGILESIFFAPILLGFLAEWRKRKHAVNLSLGEEEVALLSPKLAGLDDLLNDIQDLIDRARNPDTYSELRLGNEIMIAGPPLSGKKALARRIAKDANFDRIIIVHNPRNADALARAKYLALRARHEKVMLLLPRLDLIDEREDEEVLVELDALIEATSELSHTLVVGTTNHLSAGSEIDNLFGVTLTLPGAPIVPVPQMPLLAEVHRMLAAVANFYVDRALKAGYRFEDMTREGYIASILMAASNPAQIEDIVVLCQTTAIYKQSQGKSKDRVITAKTLDIAIRRVVVTDDVKKMA